LAVQLSAMFRLAESERDNVQEVLTVLLSW